MAGKTTTTTREYDDQGRCVKETTIEAEWPQPPRDNGQWRQPPTYPWQYPTVSYIADSNTEPLILNGGHRTPGRSVT